MRASLAIHLCSRHCKHVFFFDSSFFIPFQQVTRLLGSVCPRVRTGMHTCRHASHQGFPRRGQMSRAAPLHRLPTTRPLISTICIMPQRDAARPVLAARMARRSRVSERAIRNARDSDAVCLRKVAPPSRTIHSCVPPGGVILNALLYYTSGLFARKRCFTLPAHTAHNSSRADEAALPRVFRALV